MSDPLGVKICGLTRRVDAETAAELGADYLGVVLSAGFRRSVDPAVARGLVAGLAAVPVAVLVDEEAQRAATLAEGLGAGVVQLHGDEAPEDVRLLRDLGPWRIWKAVRARDASDVLHAVSRYGDIVHGILVEGRAPGVVGGGGARLDPGAVGRLRDLVPPGLELVVAGGLTPETVAAAVDRFGPDVVDVSSGVEDAGGGKSPTSVRQFIEEARAAARRSSASPPRPHRGAHS